MPRTLRLNSEMVDVTTKITHGEAKHTLYFETDEQCERATAMLFRTEYGVVEFTTNSVQADVQTKKKWCDKLQCKCDSLSECIERRAKLNQVEQEKGKQNPPTISLTAVVARTEEAGKEEAVQRYWKRLMP
eukprot:TRINITY_DN112518_c0_g1_i1.p3 TRINITY_DN112518_c0_g1~~TRINITY_DN112518_c0_g1_i1.p3  ORF type:complete len:131 (+),score=16.09 TRINITY_DN112518_c0_g1_i1:359-751(+)